MNPIGLWARNWTCTAWLLFLTSSVYADHPNRQYDAVVSVELQSKRRYAEFAGSYTCIARFDSLQAGDYKILKIFIRNTEDFGLPIKKVSVSCGCTKAELHTAFLKAGSDSELFVFINTPNRHESGVFTGYVDLEIDEKTVEYEKLTKVRVMIEAPIRGLLSFKERLLSIEVDANRAGELKLPIISTVKAPLKQLKLETKGDLEGVAGELKTDGKNNYVSLMIDGDLFTGEKGHGSIVIADPGSGVSDQAEVFLTRIAAIKISPSIFRFRPHESVSELLVAHGIVRIAPSGSNGITISEKRTKEVAAEAKVGSAVLACKLQPLSNNIYRITLTCPIATIEKVFDGTSSSQADTWQSNIEWRIVGTNQSFIGNAPAIFPVSSRPEH